MNKWIRNIGVGCVSIAIVSAVFFGVGNENSYAVEEDSYEDEMKEALDAYENMDVQSQQQMLASMQISKTSRISNIDIRGGMDLETAMMAIQEERVRLLDEQLKQQRDLVSDRDQHLQELNELLKATQATDEAIRNGKDLQAIMALFRKLSSEMRSAARVSRQQEFNKSIENLQANAEEIRKAADQRFTAAIAQGSLQIVGGVTGVVNTEINVQSDYHQMDLDRLQSLKDKRNEAHEIMQELVQEMQNSRSSIIGNMR